MVAGGCNQAPEAVAAQEPASCAGVPPMAFAGRVNDGADILTDAEEARLTERLARYEQRTKHQMVVATTPATGSFVPFSARPILRRTALSETMRDDPDIARAAISGVRKPVAASGIATTL